MQHKYRFKTVIYPLKKAIPGFMYYAPRSVWSTFTAFVRGKLALLDALKFMITGVAFEWRQCRGPVYTEKVMKWLSEQKDQSVVWKNLWNGNTDEIPKELLEID